MLPRLILALVFAAYAHGHDSPDQIIASLTAEIEKNGPTAPLLYRRAIEHRALGHTPEAFADFEASLDLVPAAQTYAALAELHQSRGDLTTALSLIGRALTHGPSPALHVARARILHRAGKHTEALAEFAHVPAPDLDAVLLVAEIHRTLGDHPARIQALETGHTDTRSAVLYAAWVDALLDAGQAATALPEIESTLTNRRFKASWQVRQARALLLLDRSPEAESSLVAAVSETTTRLAAQKSTPDITLLIDRAHAHALLGDRTAAQKDLTLARAHGAPPTLLQPVLDTIDPKKCGGIPSQTPPM